MPNFIIPTISDCAFCVTAAQAWITLTPSVHSSESLTIFRHHLKTELSRAPSQTNYIIERSMLHDSVYFTTMKSLDYNIVMTFRFNNNNNNSPTKLCDGAQMANFFAIFCVLYFQRAAGSMFQHVSDLHPKYALRPHHVCKNGRHPICDGCDQARKKQKKEDRRNHRGKI